VEVWGKDDLAFDVGRIDPGIKEQSLYSLEKETYRSLE
jgi:hypothetical protein